MAIKRIVIPDSEALIQGGATPELMGVLGGVEKFSGAVKAALEAGIDDDITLVIQFPEDGDYSIFQNASFARTITQVTAICSSGSCTVTGKIGSTPLGGDPNSVTTSESVEDHDSNNEAAVGSDGHITVSSNSGCENLVVSIKYHRDLV